ncbi:MAG: Gfo/Idh/MocA family protein, partial [Anaerolineales bacterium]
MSSPASILLFGAGNRGAEAYGAYALEHPDQVRFVGVAEPNVIRRERFAKAHGIPTERQFTDWQAALMPGKFADAVINATQDAVHHPSSIAALATGYDMLLEKPMAPTLAETVEIVQAAEASGRLLMICHVLRYTDFFQKVHQILESGRLGQVINISHSENVSYFHMAHSYVRGNWRNSEVSAPMILAKCCHDLDLLYWFLGEKVTHLSSFGNLRHFQPKNAPAGAPQRCTDGCPIARTCPYYAPSIYLDNNPIKKAVSRATHPFLRFVGRLSLQYPHFANGLGKILPPLRALTEYHGWPRNTITERPESDQAVMQALQNGPYGRCVYYCDNTVVDHQVVEMVFESGITATLTMHGHSHEEGRTLRMDGSRATLLGKFSYSQSWIEVHDHTSSKIERFTFPSAVDQTAGHGGGDAGLMAGFVAALQDERIELTSARDALESHLLAFAAEEARLNQKVMD